MPACPALPLIRDAAASSWIVGDRCRSITSGTFSYSPFYLTHMPSSHRLLLPRTDHSVGRHTVHISTTAISKSRDTFEGASTCSSTCSYPPTTSTEEPSGRTMMPLLPLSMSRKIPKIGWARASASLACAEGQSLGSELHYAAAARQDLQSGSLSSAQQDSSCLQGVRTRAKWPAKQTPQQASSRAEQQRQSQGLCRELRASLLAACSCALQQC